MDGGDADAEGEEAEEAGEVQVAEEGVLGVRHEAELLRGFAVEVGHGGELFEGAVVHAAEGEAEDGLSLQVDER